MSRSKVWSDPHDASQVPLHNPTQSIGAKFAVRLSLKNENFRGNRLELRPNARGSATMYAPSCAVVVGVAFNMFTQRKHPLPSFVV